MGSRPACLGICVCVCYMCIYLPSIQSASSSSQYKPRHIQSISKSTQLGV